MIGDGSKFKAYKKTSIPVYKTPKSVQQTIPIFKISENGVFQIEPDPSGSIKTTTFDKVYRFSDVNYTDLDQDEQIMFIENFCSALNYMNSSFKEVIINRNVNEEVIENAVLYKEKKGYEELTDAYNALNKKRIADASSITREKLLVVTCTTSDFNSANIQFNNMEANLKQHFNTLGSSLTPLTALERLELLHGIYNMGRETEFVLTENDIRSRRDWRDDVINVYMKENKGYLEFEDRFVTTLFAKSYPPALDDDFLVNLTSLPLNMITTIDCAPIPNSVTEKMLNDALNRTEMTIQRQQEYRNRHNDFSSEITYDVQRRKDQIIGDLDELKDNNAKMFYAGFTITLFADSLEELSTNVDRVVSLGEERFLLFKRYVGRQIQAFNTSLPVGYRGVKNMRSLFTQCVASLMPFHVQELDNGDGSIIYGTNQVSKQLIRGNRKKLANGNGFIFGSTGFGKSVSAKTEIGQVLISSDDDIILIDPQNEYYDITRQWGGQFINLSAMSDDYMNPFEIQETDDNLNDIIATKSEVAMAICIRALEPLPFNPYYRSIIDRCVGDMYRDYFIGKTTEVPTFVTFRDELKKQPEKEAEDLVKALEIFVSGSLSFFSHPTNVNLTSRLTCFGMSDLGKSLWPMAMLVMLENVRNRVISNAKVGRATWVAVDECHNILNDDFGLSTFDKLWREVRKRGGLMTGITQNVLDCLQNRETRALFSNSEYVCVLSQSPDEQEEFADILGLSAAQRSYITNAPQGTGVIRFGDRLLPFDNRLPKDSYLYKMFNTNFHEKVSEGMFTSAEKPEDKGEDMDEEE